MTRAPAASSVTIPVTILAGYLGAGKTTLVNHLLRHAAGRRIAVLVNEFGSLPIDGDLIEAADGNLLTLAGGCICCSFGDDLTAALLLLAPRTDSIDHIVIEASGVALPGAIARTLGLLSGLAHDATIVLVDAEQVLERAADRYIGDTITRQLADADLVVVNKCDLVTAETLAAVLAWLPDIAPAARIVEARHGAVSAEVVLGLLSTRLFRAATFAPHDLAAFESASFDVPGPVDTDRLAAALADPAWGLVRAKGFLCARDGRWITIQGVGSRFAISPATDKAALSTGRLVCITHGRPLDRAGIAALLVRFSR